MAITRSPCKGRTFLLNTSITSGLTTSYVPPFASIAASPEARTFVSQSAPSP